MVPGIEVLVPGENLELRLVVRGKPCAMRALDPGETRRRNGNNSVVQRSPVSYKAAVVAGAYAQRRSEIETIGAFLRPPRDLRNEEKDYAQPENSPASQILTFVTLRTPYPASGDKAGLRDRLRPVA